MQGKKSKKVGVMSEERRAKSEERRAKSEEPGARSKEQGVRRKEEVGRKEKGTSDCPVCARFLFCSMNCESLATRKSTLSDVT